MLNEKGLKELFQPLQVRNLTIKNRIMSSGHDTAMPTDGLINDRLLAYQEARAKGGAGLIVLQVSGVHETARYTTQLLMATDDESIEGYRKMAEMCHRYGCTLFAQIFHPGREIMESGEGLLAVAYAPSAVPNERFHVMPKPLTQRMIDEIVEGYAEAARRMWQAGVDGVEFVASHGYLPAQFINPRVNLRDDQYGGSLENRLRFCREVLTRVREKTDDDFVIGMRISSTEYDENGLTADEVLDASIALEPLLDYLHITAGTSASLGGAIHITPPMAYESGYLATQSKTFKERMEIPIFVTGRINQPQDADLIIGRGEADLCGMTRAMICDPEMPNKAKDSLFDDIRACIGCNQACIGHFHKGEPISCIQYPESGREERYGTLSPVKTIKKVMVIGGGPAGMKAALTATKRGHDVTLYEASHQLGGQANLAQLLSRREEFGGLITNLVRELELAKVNVMTDHYIDQSFIESNAPDVVILATGAKPYMPEIFQDESVEIVSSWDLLSGKASIGNSVLISDWRGDWIAPGIAEHLVKKGHQVQLGVNGNMLGETIPFFVRDEMRATLSRLDVPITFNARLYGCDNHSVFMQHNISEEAIIFDDIDTVVACHGHLSVDVFGDTLNDVVNEFYRIGDCLTARTAEEAIFEGLKIGAII